MADALGVLLSTWNQAFYRYGPMDYNALEQCIALNQVNLEVLRTRNIVSYNSADDTLIQKLYNDFLDATQISEGKKAGTKSPVSTAKALHLLAPEFMPLWDDKIAQAYKCHYDYVRFIQQMKKLAETLESEIDAKSTGRSLLKLIDEYNYAKFTKQWI